MTPDILSWLDAVVKPLISDAKTVYEVGALNVNGSARDVLQVPAMKWVGMDYQYGNGVDVIVSAGMPFNVWWQSQSIEGLGNYAADVVISCEAFEHDYDPYGTLLAMRKMLKPGGFMVITTPGQDFPHHAYPYDYFRVGMDWIREIAFKNAKILDLRQISLSPYTTIVGVAQMI